jgi:hypothetical protein
MLKKQKNVDNPYNIDYPLLKNYKYVVHVKAFIMIQIIYFILPYRFASESVFALVIIPIRWF